MLSISHEISGAETSGAFLAYQVCYDVVVALHVLPQLDDLK